MGGRCFPLPFQKKKKKGWGVSLLKAYKIQNTVGSLKSLGVQFYSNLSLKSPFFHQIFYGLFSYPVFRCYIFHQNNVTFALKKIVHLYRGKKDFLSARLCLWSFQNNSSHPNYTKPELSLQCKEAALDVEAAAWQESHWFWCHLFAPDLKGRVESIDLYLSHTNVHSI